jgi:hypothetical protein
MVATDWAPVIQTGVGALCALGGRDGLAARPWMVVRVIVAGALTLAGSGRLLVLPPPLLGRLEGGQAQFAE